jgi:hypothetical protein
MKLPSTVKSMFLLINFDFFFLLKKCFIQGGEGLVVKGSPGQCMISLLGEFQTREYW